MSQGRMLGPQFLPGAFECGACGGHFYPIQEPDWEQLVVDNDNIYCDRCWEILLTGAIPQRHIYDEGF